LLGAPLDRLGRVVVLPDLSVPNLPDVFVAGDLAHFEDSNGEPLPGVAPVAMQQGWHAGLNIGRLLRGIPTTAFRYWDRGNMATIGRGAAIAEIGGLKLSGLIAWLTWLFVHILFLIGFRNRIAVMMEWAWSYLTWQRGARLITGPAGEVFDPVVASARERKSPTLRPSGSPTDDAGSGASRSPAEVREDGVSGGRQ